MRKSFRIFFFSKKTLYDTDCGSFVLGLNYHSEFNFFRWKTYIILNEAPL